MTPLTQAISTALVDFLWQGGVVGALLWLALIALRHRPAQTRYLAACLALFALAVLPLLTVTALLRASAGPADALRATPSMTLLPADVPQTLLQIWMVPEAPRYAWLDALRHWALPLWTAGVVLFSIRLLGAWLHARRLAQRSLASDEGTIAMARNLAARMGVTRPVTVTIASPDEGPSVIGWLWPTILLPPAIAMGLTPRQLEAIIAHELAHVRRHDYLVNMLQTVVESVFFYHPVVWWISRCVRDEREVCCDEIAVDVVGDAVGYARALTTLARQRLEPNLSLAAARAPLLYRVQRLAGVTSRDVGPAMWPALAAIAVAGGAMALNISVHAQSGAAANQPRFDVASVKENRANDRIIFNRTVHGHFMASGYTLRGLIESAYQVQEFQIVGGPDWMDSRRFDISATYPDEPALTSRARGPSQQDLMLRSLLQDRFGLAVHKDAQERPVFALVLSRRDGASGPQLRRSSGDCATAAPGCGTSVGPGYIRARGVTLSELATAFSRLTNTGSSLNRLVVDRSGLSGAYDVDLRFTPDNIPNVPAPNLPPEALPPATPVDPNGASIFTSVQEQLGLKLEPQRAPVDVLVIDDVRMPSED